MTTIEPAADASRPRSPALNALVGSWTRLPALAALSVPPVLVLILVAALLPAASPLFPLGAVAVAVTAAPLLAVALSTVDGEFRTARSAISLAVERAPQLLGWFAPPAISAALTSVAAMIWLTSGQAWMLVPCALGLSGTGVLAAVGAVGAAGTLSGSELRGLDAWRAAAQAAVRGAAPVLGALVAVGGILWLGLAVNAVLLVMFLPPGVVLVAYLLDSARRRGRR